MTAAALSAVLCAALTGACPPSAAAESAHAAAGGKSKAFSQEGMASYYSHRSRNASGGWSNPNSLSAAHRHLPFGSRVIVTNIKTGKQVTVTVNDRGPFHRGRIIDLSRAAARQLGINGVARVRILAVE